LADEVPQSQEELPEIAQVNGSNVSDSNEQEDAAPEAEEV